MTSNQNVPNDLLAEDAETDVTNLTAHNVVITGAQAIDRIINELCPEIRFISEKDITIIAEHIEDHIIEGRIINQIIQSMTNQAVAQFIEGISIIARENEIDTIAGIQE